MAPAFGSSAFPAATEISDSELAEIGAILSSRNSFCLAAYKSACMKRRIAIRMRATRCTSPAEYCSLLEYSALELELLQKALTIHVSQFFRNPSLFDKLRAEILPALLESAHADGSKTLHIWCLGCAGGEEPYSMAIILREFFGRELKNIAITITGTDIDSATLVAAQKAIFDEDRLKSVAMELRERYFHLNEAHPRLIREIRDMVTFVQGDISNTEKYLQSSLVLCRNTLIYFTRPEQEKILNGIADILPTGGILVLGKSETLIGASRRRFSSVSQTERIYRKIA